MFIFEFDSGTAFTQFKYQFDDTLIKNISKEGVYQEIKLSRNNIEVLDF